jgi:hypothetical protein
MDGSFKAAIDLSRSGSRQLKWKHRDPAAMRGDTKKKGDR